MNPVTDQFITSLDVGDFDPEALVAAKGAQRVSVCIPARNEAATVGPIVATIHDELVVDHHLVDEVVVVDDHSSDETAQVAGAAGARVVHAGTVLTEHDAGHGKGEALWLSLHESTGDLIVWCDADLVDFDAGFVVGLLGPLLCQPTVKFVKAFYDRPLDGRPSGGGRVTELVARPVLAMLFPELARIVQPLAGECAGRRHVLERIPFARGYGVDIGLLIDVVAMYGAGCVAQVDLGTRTHRNRPYEQLAPMAAEVLATALRRAEPRLVADRTVLNRPGHDPIEVRADDLPPLVEIPAYRRSA